MTERVDTVSGTANNSVFAGDEIVAAAGATGTRTITATAATSVAAMIAFKGA
jgi:hypothetical protein